MRNVLYPCGKAWRNHVGYYQRVLKLKPLYALAIPFVTLWWCSFLNVPLQWRHNGHDSVSNHQPHDCLLNRVFRRRSKETSKLRVTGLCAGNSPGPVNSPHKGPVTRKMFPFDDVIMVFKLITQNVYTLHRLLIEISVFEFDA